MMEQVALVSLCLAFWWTFMVLMVLSTGYYRRWQTERRFQTWIRPVDALPRCLLIRPCSGEDAEQLTCLTSAIDAEWTFPLEVIIGVDSEDDPAFGNATRAVDILNQKGIESSLQIISPIGPNSKVSILAGCVAAARSAPDIIISADSNTDLTGFDLNRFVAPLCKNRGGAAIWAPPWVSSADRNWGNLASEAVLHGSWHSFGLLSAISPGGMVGKLFAVTREALGRIGGFGAMARYLGEDMEMSRRLRRVGDRVAHCPMSIRTTAKRTSWTETVARHTRWMMVIKAQRRPLMFAFPFLFFNALIVYLLAAVGLFYNTPSGVLCLLATLLLRLLVGYSAARMLGLSPRVHQVVAHAFVADILLLSAFVRALRTRHVEWRGKTLTVTSEGELGVVFRKP